MEMLFKEHEKWKLVQKNKLGDYVSTPWGCIECKASQIILGFDDKHRCERCGWCVEDGAFDYDFLEYIRG